MSKRATALFNLLQGEGRNWGDDVAAEEWNDQTIKASGNLIMVASRELEAQLPKDTLCDQRVQARSQTVRARSVGVHDGIRS